MAKRQTRRAGEEKKPLKITYLISATAAGTRDQVLMGRYGDEMGDEIPWTHESPSPRVRYLQGSRTPSSEVRVCTADKIL